MDEQQESTQLWAIVELMGRDRTAGRYAFENGLHRIDVPQENGGYRTEYVGNGAIFRISMVDEEAARLAAQMLHRNQHQPIGVWELKTALKQLQAPAEPGSTIDHEPDDDDYDIHDDITF